jgi:aspartyl-tRNA(Asn)/glutamyl-tRNA(Gln) amidotransferase subunit C
MPITQAEVERIAELANVELTPDEKVSFSVQLAAIVEYIDQLNELDTSQISTWRHVSAGSAIDSFATRDDEVKPSIGQDKATENAPDADEGYYRVPRVIGG